MLVGIVYLIKEKQMPKIKWKKKLKSPTERAQRRARNVQKRKNRRKKVTGGSIRTKLSSGGPAAKPN